MSSGLAWCIALTLLLSLSAAQAAPNGTAKTEAAKTGAERKANARAVKKAAASFDRGNSLYGQGRYAEAIEAFGLSHRLAPHPFALFNIARCYQSLAQPDAALRYYQQSLALTKDAAQRAKVQQLIATLQSLPVDVLVSSKPPGAEVFVDARLAETQRTPLVVKLAPGPHRLLLRQPGYRLAARRLVVERGKTTTLAVALQAEPGQAATRPIAQCPASQPTSKPAQRGPTSLVDASRFHARIALISAISLTSDRLLAAGPGLQLHFTFHRLVVGAHFLLSIEDEREIAGVTLNGVNYNRAAFRRLQVELQGGWFFPFRHFYVYATGGLGMAVDRAIFGNANDDLVKERFAFAWSLGGGIEAPLTTWLSFGAGLRVGLAHGERFQPAAAENPELDSDASTFPFGQLWASATFHL